MDTAGKPDCPSAAGTEPGSSSATSGSVPTIPQKKLRNDIGEVLRRAEAGEEITITVQDREAARLGPAHHRQWVSGPALDAVWQTPTPRAFDTDLERFPARLIDPFR